MLRSLFCRLKTGLHIATSGGGLICVPVSRTCCGWFKVSGTIGLRVYRFITVWVLRFTVYIYGFLICARVWEQCGVFVRLFGSFGFLIRVLCGFSYSCCMYLYCR